MAEYLSPGVYMEEVEKGPKPIQAVSTSTAAFVGFTEKIPEIVVRKNGNTEIKQAIGQPRLITNWTQYTEEFGGLVEGAYLPYAVRGFFENGGQRCYIISLQEVPQMPKAEQKLLNGQLVVQAKLPGTEGARLRFKIDVAGRANGHEPPAEPLAELEDETKPEEKQNKPAAKPGTSPEPSGFNIHVQRLGDDAKWKTVDVLEDVTVTEFQRDGRSKKMPQVQYKYDRPSEWIDILMPKTKPALIELEQTEETEWHYLGFEKAQLPMPDIDKLNGDQSGGNNLGSLLEALDDVSIVCAPDLMIAPPGQEEMHRETIKAVQSLMLAHCEKMGDRVAILDAPPDLTPQQVKEWRMQLPDSSYGALYYPWIEIKDPVQKRVIALPPSGHLAGIWARTDTNRGVHKAPANETVLNIMGVTHPVSKNEQDVLNPKGINCIREFPGRGIRVWGARTLSSNPSWRYLNVRRLFNFVKTSIERDTQWVVFEPNDSDLWARVSRDVTVFLKGIWRAGMLFGNTEEQAFYVKCDEELNPAEARREGKLHIEIGLAPTMPAEFVIFQITQWEGDTA